MPGGGGAYHLGAGGAQHGPRDFSRGIAGLQATNLLKYKMKGGSWIAIRPSGTEPKLKMYCSLVEKDEAAAKAKFAAIREKFEQTFAL